jgi:ubiquinone/menaquinone biosynthesis C-methylase UbiE
MVAYVQAAQRVAVDDNPRCPDHAVQLVRADAQKFPLVARSFDAVLAFDVIEHIEEDCAALAELVRMLANG